MSEKKKANPKKSMQGMNFRTKVSFDKTKDNEYSSGFYRSQEFEDDGYHTNPETGKAGNTKYSKNRKDFLIKK